MKGIKNLIKDESGASAVEYGLLVTLIALGIIAGAGALGTKLSDFYTAAGNKLVVP